MRPLVLAGGLLVIGCASPLPPQADLVIIAPRFLDVARGEVRRDQAVIIRNGTIDAIEAAPRASRVRAPRLQLPEDSTLLPGFIDAHVHLAWEGVPSDEPARATLLAGFTTVRSADTVAAIVDEAHRRGVRVAAHAQGPLAIRLAANAGVDSIEHGALIDADTAALLTAKRIALVPTLARLDTAIEAARARNAAPDTISRLETLRNETFARVRAAHALGAQLVFGTDGGVLPHGENAREFRALAEIGLSPLETIRAATIDASKLIGWEGRVGEIAPGRFADLVAVCGDPLASPASFDVALVIARGRVLRDETARCAP